MALGIQKRPRRTLEHRFEDDPAYLPPDSGNDSDILPRGTQHIKSTPYVTDEAVAYEPQLTPDVESAVLQMVRPRTVATPISGEMETARATRPREANPPRTESERLQRDYGFVSQQPHDRNGRLKSALWNMFQQMSVGANQVLASGRPVDEYGLASVVGRGLGGAGRGLLDPKVDEEYKRRSRMADLEHQIATQLKIEQEAAQTDKLRADATYARERPDIEAAKRLAADKPPKPFVIAGKRINYRRPEDWDGTAGKWEPYEETVKDIAVPGGRKALVDTSKMPDDDGFLPSDKLRKQLSDDQIKARRELAEANNRFKASEAEKDRKFKRSELSERIAARLERDKQARVRAGQAVTRIKISLANAMIEARSWGVSIDDYIDALSDNGVEVVEK
jgi:hypothetical protein